MYTIKNMTIENIPRLIGFYGLLMGGTKIFQTNMDILRAIQSHLIKLDFIYTF